MRVMTLIFAFLLLAGYVFASFERPIIHSTIMLDTNLYSGENANNGIYNNTDRFQVRKATLSLEGPISDRVEYFFEFGISTCVGQGDQLKLMEAGLLYELFEDMHIGIQQGHILYGFATTIGCNSRLSLEKPDFVKTFGTCHPLGFVANYYRDFGAVGLEIEISLVNGSSGTLNDEKGYNFGFELETPLPGLSLTSVYNLNEREYYNLNFEEYSKTGHRMIAGLNYLHKGLWLTGEYYSGKGFSRENQKMEAWYGQAGYEFKTGLESLPAVQPFFKYEFWDKDKTNEIQDEVSVIESGVNLKLSGYSMIKCAYRMSEVSSGKEKIPSVFILRLQTGF
jgi:hypothetical protein